MNYSQYCNLMWKLADAVITDAEAHVHVKLNSGDRRQIKQIVIWKLVEVSQLPIDLAALLNPGMNLSVSAARSAALTLKFIPQTSNADLASHPGLPLDLEIAPLPKESEIKEAIARLLKQLPAYRMLILQKLSL